MKVGDKLYRPFIESGLVVRIKESTINDIRDDWILVHEEDPKQTGTFRLEPIFMGLVGKAYFLTRFDALDCVRTYVRSQSDKLLEIAKWVAKEMGEEWPKSTTDTTLR